MTARSVRPPEAVQSITIRQVSRGAGFDGAWVVTTVTVILTSFGKALLGRAASNTWDYLKERFRRVRAKGPVEVVYGSKTESRVEIVMRYESLDAFQQDFDRHVDYIDLAVKRTDNSKLRPGETLSLTTEVSEPNTSQARVDLLIRNAG